MSVYDPTLEINDGWGTLRTSLKKNFSALVKNEKMLYRVKVAGLWEAFLCNIDERYRQQYQCRTCRHFVERYGNIVVLHEDGSYVSPFWGMTNIPDMFVTSFSIMNEMVMKAARVNGIFASDKALLGTPETDGWTHMYAILPDRLVNKSRLEKATQIEAKYKEEYRTLANALQEYSLNTVAQAIELLKTNAMYRSDRILGHAKWFGKLQEKLQTASNNNQKNNMIWYATGTAPNGYCHIKSSVIGSLLDDIVAGYSTRVIKARFEEKMNPTNYMRSQSAPTVNAIEQAEKIVEKLGIADSLRRRYAHFDEVKDHCIWLPKQEKEEKKNGVFSHLSTKAKDAVQESKLNLPTSTMTWVKFARTVLPDASKIEVLVDNPSRFMAMVTEAVVDSEPILNWDNPFSWYYHSGIDGEMKRRVESAGGRYEDCEIRCSLMWNSYTDLDLHCMTPSGDHIHFGNKRAEHGWLDVDANGGRASTCTPVENIRWKGHAPEGKYTFWVHNYCDRNHRNNPYSIELAVGGQVFSYTDIQYQTGDNHTAFEFIYQNGQVKNMKARNGTTLVNKEAWGITLQSFVEAKGIVPSPNTWDKHTTNGEHLFFILKDCKDSDEGSGRGFFNEILKPEFHAIRKTLEVYTAETPIEGADEADACGIGYVVDRDWDLTLKVVTDNSKRLIKIDRYD